MNLDDNLSTFNNLHTRLSMRQAKNNAENNNINSSTTSNEEPQGAVGSVYPKQSNSAGLDTSINQQVIIILFGFILLCDSILIKYSF